MATGSGINTIAVQTAQPEEVDAEENYFRPLTPFNIKRMMSNYGLTSKALINNILTRLAVLEDGASAQSADVEPEIDKE